MIQATAICKPAGRDSLQPILSVYVQGAVEDDVTGLRLVGTGTWIIMATLPLHLPECTDLQP